MMAGDRRDNDRLAMQSKARQRTTLIRLHEAAVADDVGGKDCGETAFHRRPFLPVNYHQSPNNDPSSLERSGHVSRGTENEDSTIRASAANQSSWLGVELMKPVASGFRKGEVASMAGWACVAVRVGWSRKWPLSRLRLPEAVRQQSTLP